MEEISSVVTTIRNKLYNQEQQPSKTSLDVLKPVEELNNILLGYTPDKQNLICKNEDFCYFDNAPTLAVLNANYDSEASVAWLIPQIKIGRASCRERV